MKIKGVIFDFDGTLADTLPICILSFQQAFENILKKTFTKEEIIKYFGQTEEGITQAIAKDKWELCFQEYLNVYSQNHSLCPNLFDGAINLLDTVKNNGFKTAMVTGKGRKSAEISLKYYNIGHYFEHIETGSPKGSIKHECMNLVIDKWDISPAETLYIGDAPSDITDSKKAGVIPISACWASTANKNELETLNPYKIFENITELENWIKTLI